MPGSSPRHQLITGGVWLGVYLGIVLAPLGVLLLAPTPSGGGFWWDASMGLGFAGLTMMAVQFVLTARFKRATAPFGIDVIYAFHRYLAYALLVVVALHPLILILRDPVHIEALTTPWRAPPEVAAGTLAAVLLLALVGAAAFRKPLGIPYEGWRLTHLLLSIGAVGFAFWHMLAVGHYTGVPVVRALWWLIGLSLAAIVVHVRILRPLHLLRRPFRVTRVEPERSECWVVHIEPIGHPGFGFEPGQFAWLSLGRSPLSMNEHPFSIASSPEPSGGLTFVIKELGDFTRTIGNVSPGTVAYADGPYGAFSIDRHPDAPGYVFLAGGIGIAPMVSMVRALADRDDPRPLRLFAAHSRWDRIPLRDELAELEAGLNLEVVHVLESPPDDWAGEEGWITRDVLDRHLPAGRRDFHYFICGPVPMIRAMEGFLAELGVPRPHVHTELFDMV